MTNETKTCQVKMANSQPCGRPTSSPTGGDGKCICHSEDPNKDVALFNMELRAIPDVRSKHSGDYTEMVFPESGYDLSRGTKYEMWFDRARFLGPANFTEFEPEGPVSFVGTEFKKGADFSGSSFHSHADFSSAQFNGFARFDNRRFKSAEFHDARFPEGVSFHKAEFAQTAGFREARFGGEANFGGTIFSNNVDFTEAKLNRSVNFKTAQFLGVSLFVETKFLGNEYDQTVTFQRAIFGGETKFVRSQFSRNVTFHRSHLTSTARVTFDAETDSGLVGTIFESEASFTSLRLESSAELTFRKVELDRCLFLETRVRDVQFVGVDWPRRQAWKWRWLYRSQFLRRRVKPIEVFYREAVYDDLQFDSNWTQWNSPNKNVKQPKRSYFGAVAALYRELQANYIDNYDYPTAGAFYLGEQEMIRKGKHWSRRWFGTSVLYRMVAYYGESFIPPLFWLLATLVLVPVYLLLDGINLYSETHEVNYEWSWSFSDLLFLKVDYWNAVGANLSLATFNRGAIGKYLVEPYKHGIITLESAVLIVLVSFLVLALRRAFKRKSF